MIKNKKALKALLALSCTIVICAILTSYLPVNGEEKIYDDLIRLHVIAATDSDEDQALKLEVRDAVLKTVSSLPKASDKSEAETGIAAHSDRIREAAEKVVAERGYTYPVRVEFDTETYPEREYEGFSLPAGEYTSLRVVIGEGKGHNWWCVIFPPLCTATSEAEREEDFLAVGFTGEQYRLISRNSETKYKVRFKILEIFSDLFGIDY